MVIEHLHCVFFGVLADGKRGCQVYDRRFEKAPWCLHSTHAARVGALRTGCPYSEGLPGKVRVSPEEYTRLWPEILRGIIETAPLNPNFTWKKFLLREGWREPDYALRLHVNAAGSAARLVKTPTAWARIKKRLLS